MKKMKAIEIKNLSRIIANRHLLEDINWEVRIGENWTIFGMNGSGKTTLLSILAGFQAPTAGSLKILGREYGEGTSEELRKEVGFISSSYFGRIFSNESLLKVVLSGLNGGFHIEDNVSLKDVGIAIKMLDAFKLKSRADYPFYSLSKGEQQNVLIARALMSNPRILLLDELTSGLDIFNRKKILKLIDNLGKDKERTVISVTHFPEEATEMYEKGIILKDGRILVKGALPDVIHYYTAPLET